SNLTNRILGRIVVEDVIDPRTGEIVLDAKHEVDEQALALIDEAKVQTLRVRSPLTCEARFGICAMCYGRDLAMAMPVKMGAAVGIVAAQSIGEPGTQLTMRTLHTVGVAGEDITNGLPRVEELFEARIPKGQAIISTIEGRVEVLPGDLQKVRVVSSQTSVEPLHLPDGFVIVPGVEGAAVTGGAVVAVRESQAADAAGASKPIDALLKLPASDVIKAPVTGVVVRDGDGFAVRHEETEDSEYVIPASARVRVATGQMVQAGDALTDCPKNPQDILAVLGREAVQQYLVDEVQKVYRSQGVSINDKHIELITRQMLRKVRIETPGDTELLPGEIHDRFHYEEVNQRVLAEGGEPATAVTVLLGVTKASLSTESFLAAASFQETTRVLTEAAVTGQKDRLLGLQENVIIGKLIPAGTGYLKRLERAEEQRRAEEAIAARTTEDDEVERAAREFLGFGAGASDDGDQPFLFPITGSEA
ncbi:MAG: DNA-directed RNA polymerase subunit beta', partial [Chloroflexota bacterium]